MSERLAAGLLLAIASACALNWGFYAQHDAAAGLPPLSVRRPFRALRALFGNPRWLAGYGAGMTGWALYIAALAIAPLSLVQAAAGGGIGVLALLAYRSRRVVPTRRELAGIAAAATGLVLLGVSIAGQSSRSGGIPTASAAAWIAVSLAAAAVFAGPGARAVGRAPGLGAAAGILYAAGDVASKAAFSSHRYVIFFVATAALHGLGFVALQRGFQLGGVLETAGICGLLTNALPIVAGVELFHDYVPAGVMGVVRAVSFACVVAAAALLARGEAPAEAAPRSASPAPGVATR